MNRGYLCLQFNNILFMTTHLESGRTTDSINIRKTQYKEIVENYREKPFVFFGDLNFSKGECIDELYYVKPNNDHKYTYDALYNLKAYPNVRENLDRFYLNKFIDFNQSTVTILSDITISDHFPILFEFV